MLTVDLVNLIEHLEAGGDAAMHGQVFTGNVTRDGHRIKNFHEQVIDFTIEALQDFVAEGESFGHVSRLVIASQHHDVSGEVLLDGKEKNADLDAEDATIDIVTEEEVVERAWLTGLANHVQQVRVLSMDVADDANWLFNLHEVRLLGEHLQSRHKKAHYLRLGDGALSGEEVFQEAPVGNIVLTEECAVFNGLIDHAGALLVIESTVGNWVWQQAKSCLGCSTGLHHC